MIKFDKLVIVTKLNYRTLKLNLPYQFTIVLFSSFSIGTKKRKRDIFPWNASISLLDLRGSIEGFRWRKGYIPFSGRFLNFSRKWPSSLTLMFSMFDYPEDMDWKRQLNAYSADVPSVIWFLARHCLGLPRNRSLFFA